MNLISIKDALNQFSENKTEAKRIYLDYSYTNREDGSCIESRVLLGSDLFF